MMTAEPVATWLLTYALHSTLLLLLAFLATRLVRAHDVKELIWKTALLGGLISATLQTGAGISPLGGRLSIAPAPAAASAERHAGALHRSVAPAKELAELVAKSAAATAAPAEPVSAAPRRFSLPRLSLTLVLVWAAVALLLALSFAVRQLLLFVRVGRRALVRDSEMLELLDILREEAGIRRPIRLTRAEGLPTPVALGRSEICIPDAALDELDLSQKESMLAHELSHLARRDPLWLLGACLLERLFFFQPLNRVARLGIQESAEYLCDDWAVRRSGSGLTLAKCLVKVAEWMDRTPASVPVSGMAESRSQFVSRIQRLVANHALEVRPRGRWLVAAAAAAVLALVFAAPRVTAVADQPDRTEVPSPVASADAKDAADPSEESRGSEHDEAIVPALIAALADSDADVRQAAARSLGKRHDPRVVPGLLGAIRDADLDVRRSVVESLAESRDPRALDGLLSALKDEDAEIRANAASGLGELKDPRAYPALSAVLADGSAGVRRNAIRAITEMRGKRPIDPFLSALKDSDAEVRQTAVQALSEARERKAVQPLIAVMSDPNADVRQAAAHALGELHSPDAAGALATALKDGHPDVRQAAASALGELQLSEAPAPLLEALHDRNADVRQAAARALAEIKDARAVPALTSLLSDPDADVREAAVNALSEMRDAAAVQALATALKSKDPNVRKRAAEALGERD